MIRVLNAQGFAMLTNEFGVAFQMEQPIARVLYRAQAQSKDELRSLLEEWGGDPEGIARLFDDDFDAGAFAEGFANLGLTMEALSDLVSERNFYEAAYGKLPTALVLHPTELGMIATSLAKEGRIPELPDQAAKERAATAYLCDLLKLESIETDEGLSVGEYRQ